MLAQEPEEGPGLSRSPRRLAKLKTEHREILSELSLKAAKINPCILFTPRTSYGTYALLNVILRDYNIESTQRILKLDSRTP